MVTIFINMKVELVPWFKTWYLNVFGFKFGKIKVLNWPLSWSLINGKFELVPWCTLLQTWYVNLFGFVFGKWKYWIDPCRENEILVYMPTGLINEMFELVPWYKILYVNLFGFVFRKMKVLEWPLSRKQDFSLYGFMFDKKEGITCPSMSLDAKHDMWTYFVLYSVKWKYWIDPCCEYEILVYMPTSLINGMFEHVPWCETWYVSQVRIVFGKREVLEWLCLESIWFCIR